MLKLSYLDSDEHVENASVCAAAAHTFPIRRAGQRWGNLVTFQCHGNSLQVTLDRMYSAATAGLTVQS